MTDRKPNETKIVAWLLVAKKLIKFANDETSYKIGDKVMAANDFTKYPLTKGDKVEVGIQEGVVTFLRKQKSEPKGSEEAYEPTPEEESPKVAPTPTPKVETLKVEAPKVAEPTVAGEIKELTIHGVAANKKVVKFSECKEAGWFQIAEDIQAQNYETIGLKAKNKVRVQIVENKIISLVLVPSEATEQAKTAISSPETAKVEPTAAPATQTPTQAPKKEWVPYKSQDTDVRQLSIESQCAVGQACNVVGRVAASISPAPTASVINNMVEAVARSNMQLIQDLKVKYAK